MQPKELLLTTPKPGFAWFYASFPGLLAAIITIVIKGNLSRPVSAGIHPILLYGIKAVYLFQHIPTCEISSKSEA